MESVSGNYTISDKEILEYSGLKSDSVMKADNIDEKQIASKISKHRRLRKLQLEKFRRMKSR